MAAPSTYRAAVIWIDSQRPRDDVMGPAASAPIKPPMVKIEEMVAKVASDMGMQSEMAADVEGLMAKRAVRARVEMDFFLQVMTSCGALSSA